VPYVNEWMVMPVFGKMYDVIEAPYVNEWMMPYMYDVYSCAMAKVGEAACVAFSFQVVQADTDACVGRFRLDF
jgi:hypothetical protein